MRSHHNVDATIGTRCLDNHINHNYWQQYYYFSLYFVSVQNTIEMSYPSCFIGYPPLYLPYICGFPPSREWHSILICLFFTDSI